MLKILSEYHTE